MKILRMPFPLLVVAAGLPLLLAGQQTTSNTTKIPDGTIVSITLTEDLSPQGEFVARGRRQQGGNDAGPFRSL